MGASTLAYDDRGTGHPVVLIHGHPFDRTMWRAQLDAGLDGLRLVAPDLPGYGASPLREATMPMRALAGAVAELLDELGIARATVVGLSMGGLVAMELALGSPERVAGVVLAATTAAPVTEDEARTRRETAAAIERDGIFDVALDMGSRLLGPAGRRDPDLLTQLFAMMFHAPPAGAAAALRGRAERPDYSALLSGLRVPALVVAGDQDPFAPEPVVEQLVGALPDPQVLRLPGIGHLPNMEAPEAFNTALAAFARGRAGAGS